jgi:hypothetical protein
MVIRFEDRDGNWIKSWPWAEYTKRGMPNTGDHVLLHWGDYGEEVEEYVVLWRVFDGKRPDSVILVVEKFK